MWWKWNKLKDDHRFFWSLFDSHFYVGIIFNEKHLFSCNLLFISPRNIFLLFPLFSFFFFPCFLPCCLPRFLHSHVGGIPLRLRSLSVVGVASRIKSASEQRSVSPPPTTADQRNKCCIQAPHRDRKSEFQLSCQMFVSGVTKKRYFLCCNVTKYFYSVLQCKLEVLEYFY